MTAFFIGPSVTGTWKGEGEEIVCGEKLSQPVDVTLNLTQLGAVRDASSPAATDPLLEANQNIKGELDEAGSPRMPSEHGEFVGALDNAGNLNGKVIRAPEAGKPVQVGISRLLVWVFDAKLTASGGLFSYKKISGTFTRTWQCPIAPGSTQTAPSSDVINVELTRQE